MSNIKRIINIANNLVAGHNIKGNLIKLAEIFKEECAYKQEVVVLEAIFNITKEVKRLEEIGDIYAEKLEIKKSAEEYYNRYLEQVDKTFYDKYASIKDIEISLSTPTPVDLQGKLDRFLVYAEILSFLHGRTYYQEILDLKQGLFDLEEEVATYLVENEYPDLEPSEQLIGKKNYLSCILSNTGNHNDINRFAIELNPQNEAGYLNIMDDLVYYKNYEQALNVYNNEYVKAFPRNKKFSSVVDLCWFLSDKLYAIGQYFNALERQKFAIDIELENRECANV